jgi:hypothetical protein
MVWHKNKLDNIMMLGGKVYVRIPVKGKKIPPYFFKYNYPKLGDYIWKTL